MKNILFLFITTIFLTSSCKKDYDVNEIFTEDSEPIIAQYYVKGSIEDKVNNVTIPLNMENTALMTNAVTSTSHQAIQSTTDTKFVLSSTGYRPRSLVGFTTGTEEDIMLFVDESIGVKIVSDVVDEQEYARLSREDLQNLLQEGSTLSFGSQPGQVEIAFQHDNIEGYPEFSPHGYKGLSIYAPDTSEDTFEILNVSDYEDIGIENPNKGFKVIAKINCTLGFTGKVLNLKDVEAAFLFFHK